MLDLKHEELVKLVRWESIWPESLSDPSWDVTSAVIIPLLGKIVLPGIGHEILEWGDGQTFFSFLVYDKESFRRFTEESDRTDTYYRGLFVFLSLYAPLGACMLSSVIQTRYSRARQYGAISQGPGPSLDGVTDSIDDQDDLFYPVFSRINESRYRLLTRGELAQPLPPPVRPVEMSDPAAHNTYLHLLFQWSD